jgi:hypothetical protein
LATGLALELQARCQTWDRERGTAFSFNISIQYHFFIALFVSFVYVRAMKMTKRTGKIKKYAKAATPPAPDTKPKPSDGAQVELENPPPDYLLEEAMKEPDRKLLEEYIQAIKVLRDNKRFTFREISEWLKQYGVVADHNAIYRAYIRHMSNQDAAHVAEVHAHEEDERNAG